MSNFIPNWVDEIKPLRDLLCKDCPWTWQHPQQDALDEPKMLLSCTPVLELYDLNARTTVSADESSHGLGAVLLQELANGDMKPFSYFSRWLSPTEEPYAQIEKEALAFTWVCECFSHFLVGLKFISSPKRFDILNVHMSLRVSSGWAAREHLYYAGACMLKYFRLHFSLQNYFMRKFFT